MIRRGNRPAARWIASDVSQTRRSIAAMASVPSKGHDPLSLSRLRRAVDRCERFEAEFRGGGAPRIEAYLDGAAGPERLLLLRELLALELDLQRGVTRRQNWTRSRTGSGSRANRAWSTRCSRRSGSRGIDREVTSPVARASASRVRSTRLAFSARTSKPRGTPPPGRRSSPTSPGSSLTHARRSCATYCPSSSNAAARPGNGPASTSISADFRVSSPP